LGQKPEYPYSEFTLVVDVLSPLCRDDQPQASPLSYQRRTLGELAFPVAGTPAWNAMPPSVTPAPSLSSFRRLLEHLFRVGNTVLGLQISFRAV